MRQAIEMHDADDAIAMEELATLVPQLNAMADRIERDRIAEADRAASVEAQLAELRSPAYRRRLRDEIADDAMIDWDAVEAIFGRALPHDVPHDLSRSAAA